MLRFLIFTITSWLTMAQTLIIESAAACIIGPTVRRHRRRQVKASDFRNILIIRLDEIGDMVISVPMLQAIRQAAPLAKITAIAKSPASDLISTCEFVDRVIAVRLTTHKFLRPLVMPFKMAMLAIGVLRHDKYDLAILPRWDTDSFYATILAYFSGAPVRVGFTEKSTPRKRMVNMGFDRMLTIAIDDPEIKHELHHGLAMAKSLGCNIDKTKLQLRPVQADIQIAAEIIEKTAGQKIARENLIALAIGAGRSEKCWSAENFIQLASKLAEDGFKIAIIGGKNEVRAAEAIASKIGSAAINLAGKLSLTQSAAAISLCGLFVGNDSGPAHLAAACGVPTIAISCHSLQCPPQHEGSPVRFAPCGKNCIVLQPKLPTAPCTGPCLASDAHCILAITVDDVLAAIGRITTQIRGNTRRA